MEKKFTAMITILIAAVVLSALFVGLRQTSLKSAYDAASNTTVTDSQGVVHTVAASPISGDLTATLYGIAAGLIWVVAIIACLVLFFKK